ncbi:MAG: DNA mismatch repair protein MutS, partial [Proteiniphilum sp.]
RYCRSHPPTLIILDELLKGTNSKDKLDGSVLFLKEMIGLPVTGIIATHDLELAKLEEELPDRFKNYCFEISLAEGEQYSYKIQRGVSKNLNATFLLQKILSEEL